MLSVTSYVGPWGTVGNSKWAGGLKMRVGRVNHCERLSFLFRRVINKSSSAERGAKEQSLKLIFTC